MDTNALKMLLELWYFSSIKLLIVMAANVPENTNWIQAFLFTSQLTPMLHDLSLASYNGSFSWVISYPTAKYRDGSLKIVLRWYVLANAHHQQLSGWSSDYYSMAVHPTMKQPWYWLLVLQVQGASCIPMTQAFRTVHWGSNPSYCGSDPFTKYSCEEFTSHIQ